MVTGICHIQACKLDDFCVDHWLLYSSTRSELLSLPFECFWRCVFYNNECPMSAQDVFEFSPWVFFLESSWWWMFSPPSGKKQIGMARTGQRWGRFWAGCIWMGASGDLGVSFSVPGFAVRRVKLPWKSKTKQRMVFGMIHVKDSLLPMGKVRSWDFLGLHPLRIPWRT